jgi:hypothetical protein
MPLTRPSETTEGKRWLSNFGGRDVTIPVLLLDSLKIVSDTTLRASLGALLATTVRECEPPIALLPIRSMPRRQPYYRAGHKDVRRSPKYIEGSILPGSEAIVANLIRNAVDNDQMRPLVIERPSLPNLRKRRCKTLLLVDDYAGSGNSAINFARALMRNPSIRSWRSYGLISLQVVAFAASTMAHHAMSDSKHIDRVHVVFHGLDFNSAGWTEEEMNAVRELCYSYASVESMALGYGESEGLFVMQHTVPNNLPIVLWQRQGPQRKEWHPFFRRPAMTPNQQLTLSDYSPSRDMNEIAMGFRQFRLARTLKSEPNKDVRTLLLVLGALAQGIRTTERLTVELAISTFELGLILSAARSLGLVTDDNHLTDEGWTELRRAKIQPRRVTLELTGSAEFYYPKQLRGSR